MGDIADDIYDQMLDRGFGGWGFRPPVKPKCHLCGKKGLNWQQVKGSKWRLHEGKTPHLCPTSADGFEDCSDEHQPQGNKNG